MFKKKRTVYAIYCKDHRLHAVVLIFENVTKKQAKKKMYDYLCWENYGLRLGFRDVRLVTIKKGEENPKLQPFENHWL